jgi:hypothetical protein
MNKSRMELKNLRAAEAGGHVRLYASQTLPSLCHSEMKSSAKVETMIIEVQKYGGKILHGATFTCRLLRHVGILSMLPWNQDTSFCSGIDGHVHIRQLNRCQPRIKGIQEERTHCMLKLFQHTTKADGA